MSNDRAQMLVIVHVVSEHEVRANQGIMRICISQVNADAGGSVVLCDLFCLMSSFKLEVV